MGEGLLKASGLILTRSGTAMIRIFREGTWHHIPFFFSVLLLAALFIPGCSPATEGISPASPDNTEQTIEWRMATFSPYNDSRFFINLAKFADQVKSATRNRINITIYPAESLIPNSELPAVVSDGSIQIVHSVGTFWAEKMPLGTVEYYMPMAYSSLSDTWRVMWDRGLQSLLRKAYAEHNTYALTFEVGTGSYLMIQKPIRSLKDLEGKRIRATGTLGDFISRLGATAVNLPMNEIYMALKLGTIDGAILGYEQHAALNHHEICKYMLSIPITRGDPIDLLVNFGVWNSLPDDLKIILEMVGKDFSVWSGIIQNGKINQEASRQYNSSGVVWLTLSESEVKLMQNTAENLWNDWAKKDKYCYQAISIFKDYLKQRDEYYSQSPF